MMFTICIATGIFGIIQMPYCIIVNPRKAWVIALLLDQLGNLLDWLDQNHCANSKGI
jgi:hypothetical protein